MLARLGAKIFDEESDVNILIKNVKKVFQKCPRRRREWMAFEGTRTAFPDPVLTRWGTWITAVKYVSDYWTPLKTYLATIPEKSSSAAAKALAKMNDGCTITRVGFIAAVSFLTQKVVASEASDFTAAKAGTQISEITAFLIDLSETGNEVAVYLSTKWQYLIEKNQGLIKTIALCRGEGVEEPSEISIFAFAPCTSVEIERFFSVVKSFLTDRNNILEETVLKLLFIQYNKARFE